MSDFTLNRNEHIKFIIDNFDFEKVHKVMTFLNWTWGSIVPNKYELKNEATRLLNQIYDSNSDTLSISTGGLKVSKYEDHLELNFVCAGCSSEILNYGPKYEKLKLIKIRNNKLKTIKKNINENS